MKLDRALRAVNPHPHQSTRERLRRLRQIEKGMLTASNGVPPWTFKQLRHYRAYDGSLERLAAA